MRRALAASALLACAACSAVAGLDEDYLLDDTTSVATGDAGGEDVDARANPELDGGAPIDAAADAPFAPFCPDGGALFCTDFETAATVKAEWTRTEATGGDPTLVSAIGVGGSRALDARMTAGAGTAATVAWRTISAGFTVGRTITLRFSFNVKAKAANYAAIGVIQVGGIEHGLAMYDASKCVVGPSCLDENDQTGRGHDQSNTVPLALNAWHTGVVSVTRSTATSFAGQVIVDGVSVDNRTTGALPASAANGTPVVEVGVGSFYSSGAGTNDVVIDDVLVTNQLP